MVFAVHGHARDLITIEHERVHRRARAHLAAALGDGRSDRRAHHVGHPAHVRAQPHLVDARHAGVEEAEEEAGRETLGRNEEEPGGQRHQQVVDGLVAHPVGLGVGDDGVVVELVEFPHVVAQAGGLWSGDMPRMPWGPPSGSRISISSSQHTGQATSDDDDRAAAAGQGAVWSIGGRI